MKKVGFSSSPLWGIYSRNFEVKVSYITLNCIQKNTLQCFGTFIAKANRNLPQPSSHWHEIWNDHIFKC